MMTFPNICGKFIVKVKVFCQTHNNSNIFKCDLSKMPLRLYEEKIRPETKGNLWSYSLSDGQHASDLLDMRSLFTLSGKNTHCLVT